MLGRDAVAAPVLKATSLHDVRRAGNENICVTPKERIRLDFGSPSPGGPGAGSVLGGTINQLAQNGGNGSDGGGSPGGPGDNYNGGSNHAYSRRDDKEERRSKEFLLVKASNITINTFAGFNLAKRFKPEPTLHISAGSHGAPLGNLS